MNPRSTETTVNGVKYVIHKLKARDASWVLSIVMAKMLPGVVEGALSGLPKDRTAASRAEFDEIQALCLTSIGVYQPPSEVAVPILTLPDRWADPDLQYDLMTVTTLTVQSLVFTLKPFFLAGGLGGLLQILGITPTTESSPPTLAH